jgi:tetratricopeptide (TPR) repeat protein
LTSFRLVNGRPGQVVVTFPPASANLGAEAILSVHALHEACKDDDAKLARLKDAVATRAAEPSDDPNLRVARLLAEAGVLSWSGERDRAADVLSAAEALQVDAQVLASARTRLLYESGRVAEALAEVEKLRPTNQQMLVDRELAILQLVLQQGDLDRARASAQKLFALRLESDTEFKLADLMVQLGMKDLADRMMGRIRRRAGGQQDTLVRLMSRYADANDKAAAGEIARQVIRRTTPAANQYSYSADSQQHEQAVRVLHQAGELDALIEQYEGLVARSPRSTKLVDKLCAFYEAAGRRTDAQALRVRSAETAPDDPRSLVAAGQQLSALKRYGEAADKFTAAILKSPQLLDRYYEMEAAYREAKAWGRLSDAIVTHGIRKFSQSYRLGELCSQLGQQGDQAALNRLLTAALSDLSWSEMSVMMSSLGSIDLEPDPALVNLLEKKLTAGGAELANVSTSVFVWSRGPNGNTSGFVNGVARIVSADDALSERVAQAMAKRLEKAPGELFPRVLVCLVRANQKKFDDVEKAIQPLVDKKDKDAADGQALRCVASMLTHTAKKPDLACKVLESADRRVLQEERSSGFQGSAMALLAFSYEQAGRKAEACRILVDELRTAEVDQMFCQLNPGYGEYQFMESLCSLSERLLEMGYPAEAFIAWRKAFADPSMAEKALRWGGGMVANRRDSLRKQIVARRTSESLLAILQASLTDDDTSQAAAQAAAILTEPLIERSSIVDTRVTMPLAEFMEEIGPQDVRDAVARFLAEHPVPADAGTRSLKRLVARLLICDALHDTAQAAATATAITQWVEAHPPAAATTPVPDELLLGIAALRMPESVDQADVVGMVERAIAAASASHQAPLVSSLQCQIARHVAGTDPDRARALLRQTLDELLPPGPDRASGAAGKEGE